MVEATMWRWLKNEGGTVAPGEPVVELETDKITVDVPAMSNGVLKRRLKKEGDVVHVDDLLAEIEEGAAGATKPAPASVPASAPAAAPSPSAAKPADATPIADAAKPTTPAAPPPGGARVSPAAARTAAERGIDAAALSGTRRGGVASQAAVICAGPTPP